MLESSAPPHREAWHVIESFVKDERFTSANEPEGVEETWKTFAICWCCMRKNPERHPAQQRPPHKNRPINAPDFRMHQQPKCDNLTNSSRPLRSLIMAVLMAAGAGVAPAEDFNWGPTLNISPLGYTLPGLNFATPAKDQGSAGVCWDFAATGTLEARYKLTRNDTTYSIDLWRHAADPRPHHQRGHHRHPTTEQPGAGCRPVRQQPDLQWHHAGHHCQ